MYEFRGRVGGASAAEKVMEEAGVLSGLRNDGSGAYCYLCVDGHVYR